MKKNFFMLILIAFSFVRCSNFDPYSPRYRVRKTNGKYGFYSGHYYENRIFLTEKIIPVMKTNYPKYGRVYLDISLDNKGVQNNKETILHIATNKERNMNVSRYQYTMKIDEETNKAKIVETSIYEEPSYSYFKILDDIIVDTNKEKIIIPKDEIEYIPYEDFKIFNFKIFNKSLGHHVRIKFKDKFEGPIVIEIGRIEINKKIYNVPKIYMQNYKTQYDEISNWNSEDYKKKWLDK